MGNLVLWVGIFGVALVGYTYRDDLQGVASRVFGELVPGSAVVDSERRHRHLPLAASTGTSPVNADVNGADIRTIFDTGASAVVLTHADAMQGRHRHRHAALRHPRADGQRHRPRRRRHARPASRSAASSRNRVRAFVAERGALDTSLLGMTFLTTLSRYAVSGNSLELVD